MKKLLTVVIAFLVAVGLLTSCGGAPQEPTDIGVQTLGLDSGNPPSTITLVPEEPDAAGADIDYMDYIYPLGNFLNGLVWSDPGVLQASNYVEWYISYLREVQSASLTGYKLENGDGYRVPQEELEKAVAKYFGLSSGMLRADEKTYSAEDEAYILHSDIPATTRSISLKKVEESGNSCILTFTVTTNGIQQERVLEVITNTNGIQYLSLISPHGGRRS